MQNSTLSLLSQNGDEVIVEWDPKDPTQVKAAKKAFDNLRKKGCLIYEVETEEVVMKSHSKGKQVTEFPEAEKSAKPRRFLARPAFSGG